MKARLKLNGGKLEFEIEGSTEKELFKQVAKLQEVFDADDKCGLCGKSNLRYVCRTVEENDFFELVCQEKACRAKLAYGQHKKGGSLFPKRKGDDDKWLDHRGWFKWDGQKKDTKK